MDQAHPLYQKTKQNKTKNLGSVRDTMMYKITPYRKENDV